MPLLLLKNNLIDEGVMAALSGAEFKCFLLIYRKTIGWQKKADIISNSQFSQYTGLSRQSVVATTKSLEHLELISCIKCKRNMTQYQLDNRYLLSFTNDVEQQGKKLSPKEVRNLLLHRKKSAYRANYLPHKRHSFKRQLYKRGIIEFVL